MATTPEAFVALRQLQGWAVLLSCLPPDGKARELFSLALSLDEASWLDRITPVIAPEADEGIKAWLARIAPPTDPGGDQDLKEWLEYLWIRGSLSPEEQKLVDWQSDADNMAAAVAEFLAVLERLRHGRADRPPDSSYPEGAEA
jgi:hypothetical protein